MRYQMLKSVNMKICTLSDRFLSLVLFILLEDKQKFKCGEVDKGILYSYFIVQFMLNYY